MGQRMYLESVRPEFRCVFQIREIRAVCACTAYIRYLFISFSNQTWDCTFHVYASLLFDFQYQPYS